MSDTSVRRPIPDFTAKDLEQDVQERKDHKTVMERIEALEAKAKWLDTHETRIRTLEEANPGDIEGIKPILVWLRDSQAKLHRLLG